MIVGSAEVVLTPSTEGFGASARSELPRAFDPAGREAGRRFGEVAGEEASRGMDSRVRSGGFTGRIKGAFSGLGKVAGAAMAAGAAVAAGAGLAGLVGDAIGAASDVSESTSKVGVVFGDASKSVLRFADDSATAFGQSRAQALEATGTFGNLLRSVGLTERESARFSTSMVGLASDLASFNNTSTDEALEALRSGLLGEAEPLKKFGVNMNDATLKAKAMELGLSDGKDVLDSNTKAQAAYALIMEQTKLAQGDFARTSGGLANQQRILSAQWDDAKARLGSGLLPVATAVVTFLNGAMFPAFDAIGGVVRDVAGLFSGGGGGGLGSALGVFGSAVLPVITTLGREVMGVLRPGLAAIGQVVTGQVMPALAALVTALAPVARFFLQVMGRQVLVAVRLVLAVVKGAFTILAGIFNVIAGLLTGDWQRLWNGIKQILRGAWTVIVAVVRAAISTVTAILRAAWTVIVTVARRAWDAIKSATSAVWEAIRGAVSRGADAVAEKVRSMASRVRDAIAGLPARFAEIGRNMMQSMVDGIRAMAGEIANAAKEVVQGAIDGAKSLLRIGSPSKVTRQMGQDTGQGFALGLADREREVSRRGLDLASAALVRPGLADLTREAARQARADLDGLGVSLRVFIGDREITEIVRVEVDDGLDRLSRSITSRRGDI